MLHVCRYLIEQPSSHLACPPTAAAHKWSPEIKWCPAPEALMPSCERSNPEVLAGGYRSLRLPDIAFCNIQSQGSRTLRRTAATSTPVSARGAGGSCRTRAAPGTSGAEPPADNEPRHLATTICSPGDQQSGTEPLDGKSYPEAGAKSRHLATTVAAMSTPSAPPVNTRKSAGAVGGEPEDGPWSSDLFNPGGDPDSITKELSPPCSISWSRVAGRGWSQESPS